MTFGQTFKDDARLRPSLGPRLLTLGHAWHAWLIFACVVAAIVAAAPDYRTVTHNYRDACRHWFEGGPLYGEGVHGFLYFPQAAILFAPFTYLPAPAGDFFWRFVSIGGLAWAVWRLAGLRTSTRVESPRAVEKASFAVMTCVAIPPAIASARNGQMNLMLAALMALAFVELAQRRWRGAAFWFCLGAACKPLMIAPIIVAAAVYRPLFRPLLLGACVALLAPFLTQAPSYVWEQYEVCIQKLLWAGNPGWENPGSDLFGLLWSLGYAAPLGLQTASRAIAGGLTALLASIACRRRQPVYAAQTALALTACYLALFNPRMENNGYAVLSPALASLAADAFVNRRRPAAGWLMVVASIAIAGSYEITRGHNYWLCPLLALVVGAYAVFEAVAAADFEQPRSSADPLSSPARATVRPPRSQIA